MKELIGSGNGVQWCTTPSGHCRGPDFSDKPKNEGWWQFPKGLSSCGRSGIGSLLSAGLFFHDTGRYALQRAASGLLQRPGPPGGSAGSADGQVVESLNGGVLSQNGWWYWHCLIANFDGEIIYMKLLYHEIWGSNSCDKCSMDKWLCELWLWFPNPKAIFGCSNPVLHGSTRTPRGLPDMNIEKLKHSHSVNSILPRSPTQFMVATQLYIVIMYPLVN